MKHNITSKSNSAILEESYNFTNIEKKWQNQWEKRKIFEVKENTRKKKFYCLEMFPYPSATGLHMGHALNYTIGDIFARFKRMNGFNVLYPMGYDAFGLPAENAAIKAGEHPKKYTENSIKSFIMQQKSLGLSYDWKRLIITCNPDYYKWNQYFFLRFLGAGLVYRKKALVNYCEKCDTVLANEQVHNGFCWRHPETEVKTKNLEQWFIKTTKYADELLKEVDKLKWPERIKLMQKNWIGKSYGTEIDFSIENSSKKWPVFTTRPDTIYGVTFMVISAQHPDLDKLVKKGQKKDIEKLLKKIKSTKQEDIEQLEKEGAFTGSYAFNPLTNEKVPIYAGNFVVADYGSGMVMAVPAHDQRDFEFAKKYKIPIKAVIEPEKENINQIVKERAYVEFGKLINSKQFNGLNSIKAQEEITKYLEIKKLGRRRVNYKLRDWLISRQRYWGTPIPVVYCERCGIVPEKKLPIKLPENVKFGKGNPLATNNKFLNTKCPKCGGKAKRETDTMDTFFDSSWYFLRYCDNKNTKEPFSRSEVEYWMPVDQYIGGAEHACMHLIYARFFIKALRDLKYLKFGEPFTKLFNQGMLHGADGNKMSKSLGNVINPIDMINKYGADCLRLGLMSFASPDKDSNWDEKILAGGLKFLNKIYNYFKTVKIISEDFKTENRLNKTIKEVTKNIDNFEYNLAIIKIRELADSLPKETTRKVLEEYLKLLHPFCPHITEELWEKIKGKGFISLANWPEAGKINEKLLQEEKMIETVIGDITNILKILENRNEKRTKVKIFAIPNELEIYKQGIEEIEKHINLDIEIHSVKDAVSEEKTIRAKPGKPGILIV